MADLNIQFGQIPFWAICRSVERTKIEYIVFSFICAKRFRRSQEADCSRSEIIQHTNLDKSQVSVAIKNLIKVGWLEMKSKTRWFIPENAPEKVGDLSTNKEIEEVDESSTKVNELTTKVDDLSTPYNKDSHSSHLQIKKATKVAGKKPNKPPKSRAKKSKGPRDERIDHIAIKTIRFLMGRYPDKILWDGLINRLSTDFDKTKLGNCRIEWVKRGYNRTSTTWIDWYFEGIPERKINNGTNQNNSQPKRTNADILEESAEFYQNYPP